MDAIVAAVRITMIAETRCGGNSPFGFRVHFQEQEAGASPPQLEVEDLLRVDALDGSLFKRISHQRAAIITSREREKIPTVLLV